jgi:hypothetical protein
LQDDDARRDSAKGADRYDREPAGGLARSNGNDDADRADRE